MVVGRQVFVDLWAIEGFEPVVCEFPSDLPAMLDEILQEDTALVIAESDWFSQVNDSLKLKLQQLKEPVWITFPTIEIHDERGQLE
ncbi:MAG TPA: hypothetical protein PLV56_07885 [Synergistales bacterium]|nr:hypothetical protein [Synergistales bacterium]